MINREKRKSKKIAKKERIGKNMQQMKFEIDNCKQAKIGNRQNKNC